LKIFEWLTVEPGSQTPLKHERTIRQITYFIHIWNTRVHQLLIQAYDLTLFQCPLFFFISLKTTSGLLGLYNNEW